MDNKMMKTKLTNFMILLSYTKGFTKKFCGWRRNFHGLRKYFCVTIRKAEQLSGGKNTHINDYMIFMSSSASYTLS